jgi:hypothetical protein
MALINCPECSKEISDRAPACIGRGCPVKIAFTGIIKENNVLENKANEVKVDGFVIAPLSSEIIKPEPIMLKDLVEKCGGDRDKLISILIETYNYTEYAAKFRSKCINDDGVFGWHDSYNCEIEYQDNKISDDSHIGVYLVSFLIPLIGIILGIVYIGKNNEKLGVSLIGLSIFASIIYGAIIYAFAS